MDGGLRIIDFRNERLIDTFQSYFGALNCVCWSPDGRYILVSRRKTPDQRLIHVQDFALNPRYTQTGQLEGMVLNMGTLPFLFIRQEVRTIWSQYGLSKT